MNPKLIRNLTQMINGVMGQNVLTEGQLNQVMKGAKKAYEANGMEGMLGYLMKVTQADVDKSELKDFADMIQKNPSVGMDIFKKRKKLI